MSRLALARFRFRLRSRVHLAWWVCLLFLGLLSSASATTYALLVAVDRPAALPQRLWLRGPDNDAALLRQLLGERGVQPNHITWLGRAPGSDGLATRAAIEAAMQGLMQRLQPSDHLVLHLAGHSVQVPQRPGAEPEADGLDEVFLTADTQAWDPVQGVLPQALYDHDIGRFLRALAQRGVRVLALFDSCHAAGLHRAAPGRPARLRGVAAAELGVPQSAAVVSAGKKANKATREVAARLLLGGPQWATKDQGLVLALAARSHESTPEAWLPTGAPQARVHGVFSFAVVRALRSGAGDAEALRRALAKSYAQDGRLAPVPMVLGEGLLLPLRP